MRHIIMRAVTNVLPSAAPMLKRAYESIVPNRVDEPDMDALSFAPDYDQDSQAIIKAVKPFTMTSLERLFALIEAVKYVVRGEIAGDIVECGVWQGGSMMAVMHVLKSLGRTERDLWLYDTYDGMSQPTEADVNYHGKSAVPIFDRLKKDGASSEWYNVPVERVRSNMSGIEYDPRKVHFIKGKVEETIPGEAPAQISILRLDTDWYESTRHELTHLYPRLSRGGVLIIDDYGHWQGSRKAVDEFLEENNIPILLNRVDYTGRVAIKP